MGTVLNPALPGIATSLGLLFMVGAGALVLLPQQKQPAAGTAAPQTAAVAPAVLLHRLDGEYLREGLPVAAPRLPVRIRHPLQIMRYQVTVGDYARCVAAGACRRQERVDGRGDAPVTGVSHTDANDYARWLSAETGANWRLPTDLEWAHAAGSRVVDDPGEAEPSAANPAQRWLADYDREAGRRREREAAPRPMGSFGANENGVFDIAGNVWEWTDTCMRRVRLDVAGRTVSDTANCGVYIVQGRHRAPMTFFIRNPRSGGCSVGAPPDNLGFRLVRDRGRGERLLDRLRRPFA